MSEQIRFGSSFPWPLQEAASILHNLKKGKPVSNAAFDSLLPHDVRKFSGRHWTPVEVAIRAAELLVSGPDVTVLDVGSGAGKFCMLGALTTEGSFVGVEQRESLVEAAQKTAKLLGIPRVRFLHENMADLDWTRFDAFYLYNPFYENIEPTAQIDQSVLLGEKYFAWYVKCVQENLARLKEGSRVVTFHGFGGTFPSGFRRMVKEPHGDDFLALIVRGVR